MRRSTLEQITTREKAELILKLINRELDPCEVSKQASKRDAESYHPHDWQTLVMEAADEILGTCGVEGWAVNMREGVEYCNTGDPYDTTLCCVRGKFKVTNWASLVQFNPEFGS
jgi:hypothetical protein